MENVKTTSKDPQEHKFEGVTITRMMTFITQVCWEFKIHVQVCSGLEERNYWA